MKDKHTMDRDEYTRVFDRFRCPGCGYLIDAAQHWSLRCDISCVRCGEYMMGRDFIGSLTKEEKEKTS